MEICVRNMNKIDFRKLTPGDVECRVCNVTSKYINLLIYKNARVDMAILNDTVGIGWKREHNFKNGRNYCTVSIWDEDNKMWVSREDCGVESNTEAEKGESSDAFKRACFNWGIGVELYTGPKISVTKEAKDIWNDKVVTTFSVKEMTVSDNKKITHLVIVDNNGNTRFGWDEGSKPQAIPTAAPTALTQDNAALLKAFCSSMKTQPNVDIKDLTEWYRFWNGKIEKGEFTGTFNGIKMWESHLKKRNRT